MDTHTHTHARVHRHTAQYTSKGGIEKKSGSTLRILVVAIFVSSALFIYFVVVVVVDVELLVYTISFVTNARTKRN